MKNEALFKILKRFGTKQSGILRKTSKRIAGNSKEIMGLFPAIYTNELLKLVILLENNSQTINFVRWFKTNIPTEENLRNKSK